MKVVFCGGAREVGASCYLVQVDGKNVLFDCGIRMKGGKDSLPDFRRVQELGGVDAVIISHAHLDHTGCLPVISREYPQAKIYMTHATKNLIKVLLYDSLKIMNNDSEGEIPIYAEAHVRGMLDRIVCFSPQFTFKPFNDRDIKVTFYHAGHIAGAVCIYLQSQEGTIFYTGDISAVSQLTVSGASIPKLRPDVAIMESTYGDKLHSNRQIEQERLVNVVREVIERGGKILIPAFALGRAQEIILILRRAINKKQLPEFKIYIDGMVKDINRVYKLNPNYLRENLAKKIFKGAEIFYNDNIVPVTDKRMREQLAKNMEERLCVISSSGMLVGGPSAWYAEKFASDEKNFIAITGYQDEEAPGRKILEALEAREEDKTIEINDRSIPIKCGIGKYGLSAHGDKGELMGVVHKISPRKIFLVHGNESIINEFSKELSADIWAQVYVPSNGEEYEFKIRNPRKQIVNIQIPSLKTKEEICNDNIEILWKYILDKTGTKVGYSAEQLIYLWTGSNKFTNENVNKFRNVLNKTKYFTPNLRKLFLYHPASEDDVKADDANGIMEMNQMLNYIDKVFPSEAGIYKKGARYEDNICLLYFNFPKKSCTKYKDLINEFEEKTGWKVEINKNCNLMAAEEIVYSLIPNDVDITKFSYYRDKGYFLVDFDNKINDFTDIVQKFEEATGIKLILNNKKNEDLHRNQLRLEKRECLMEQNKAFKVIDDYFKQLPHKIYKKSRKELEGIPYIELSFITSQIGKRYEDIIKEIENEIGWNIVIGQNPNQNEIVKVIKKICRNNNITLEKNPSVFNDEARLEVKVSSQIDEEKMNLIKDTFMNETGYSVEFKGL